MHVFICWSGRRSRRVAEEFSNQWLRVNFGDTVSSFVSFSDIEKGEGWFERVLAELVKADTALLCLTPENLSSPWMHFEAGMVARMGNGRVFTYFLGTDARTVQDPLKQIQVTVATKLDTERLAQKLATLANVELEVERKAKAWDSLATAIREVGAPTMEDIYPGFAQLFERKTFDERLEDCADQLWLKRFEAVRETSRALVSRQQIVADAAEQWQTWLYDKLLHQVDAYGDEIRQYLLREQPFEVGDAGRIDFGRPRTLTPSAAPKSLSTVCERRCREIRHVVFCLSSAAGAPVLLESLGFAKLKLNQFDDKKRLVHARGLRVDRAALGLSSDAELERCASSVWDYDRIMYYKARETEPTAISTLIGLVDHELEKTLAEDDASKMPLYYAVKTLLRTIRENADERFDQSEAERLVEDLQHFLDGSRSEDDDHRLRRNVTEIQQIVASRRHAAL